MYINKKNNNVTGHFTLIKNILLIFKQTLNEYIFKKVKLKVLHSLLKYLKSFSFKRIHLVKF